MVPQSSPLGALRGVMQRFSSTMASALLLGIGSFMLYGHTLSGYFLGDDFAYVTSAAALPFSRWLPLFVSDLLGDVWGDALRVLRPFTTLAGMLQASAFGGNPLGYRITGLVLHIASTWLVFAIGRNLLPGSRWTAFGAALLFAAHPVHVEAVVWIGGQSDLLPTFFLLGAFLAFLKFRAGGGWTALITLGALAALAVFTKENAVVLPALLAGYDLLWRRDIRATRNAAEVWRRAAPYVVVLLVLLGYFICRRIAFGATVSTTAAGATVSVLLQALPLRYSQYIAHLLWPLDLSFAANWPLPAKAHLLLPFLLLFIAVPLAAARWHRGDRGSTHRVLWFTGATWFVVTSLPFLLSYSSPRHLYVTSAGFCLFVAALVQLTCGSRQRLAAAGVIALLASFWSYGVRHEAKPWKRAGAITREFQRHVARMADKPPGTALIIDVPGYHGQVGTLAWGIPFALDYPLFSPPLKDRLIVLSYPHCYYAPHLWSKNPAIGQLSSIGDGTDVYLMSLEPQKRRIRTRRIEPVQVRNAIHVLQQKLASSAAPPYELHWYAFKAALDAAP